MSGDRGSEFRPVNALEVNDLIVEMKEILAMAYQSGIPETDIVNIGGATAMLHSNSSQNTTRWSSGWRGTHDLDIVLTFQGGRELFVQTLKEQGVEVSSSRRSGSIRDKWALEIELGTGKGAFRQGRILEIDIYTATNNKGDAKINNRTIHAFPHNFITEPVGQFQVGHTTYTVPSVIDCLALKTDVIPQVRDKDRIDINALLFAAENYGIKPEDVVSQLRSAYSTFGIVSGFWKQKVVPEISSIVRDPLESDYTPVSSNEFRTKLLKKLK